ncbi:SAM-dependent methyltransferase [Streptomyces celluloflavus]|uniref:S-adenosyl-L-methionine-dependent methyltransferase n=1 Tax=Streptomyces celluloflavus TaxID=58344 RepID=A0ABW7R6J8_9ACTN|nr:SAM-dependent methyltransferase [Streptomyces celluloflavus]
METVSYTSQWTAAARALESERSDALFSDPLARSLAEPRGFELLDQYGGGGLVEFVAIRTRYLDDAINDLVGQGVRQVVLIAAGMDTRALRLKLPDDITLYEVDHQALITEKEKRLARLAAPSPSVRLRRVGADLAGDWSAALRDAGFDPALPTLWVPEALLFFLTEEQSATLLRTLAANSAPGSWVALDILSKSLLRNPAAQIFLSALKSDGIPWLFGTDTPEEFLAGTGWTVRELKEPGEPGAGEGRWPYAVQPREVGGVARNWLIRAELT